MPKRIAFCCDGTWQDPSCNTNVYRLYNALAVSSDQVTFYENGVGADGSLFQRIAEGAFGQGLLDKIKIAYTKIAHVYEVGDEIFLFGFSRGAYTARSLAGMIAICGLPSGSFTDDCVDKAFQAYRDRANRAAILAGLSACGLHDACIRMLGVWDTVGSLGIPAIVGQVDRDAYGFLDTDLHPDVKNAFQALAIDEKRPQFPATLWTGDPAPEQVIEQVWFSGCHSDVGGGTAMAGGVDGTTRLCDIPFAWMLSKAMSLGLTVNPTVSGQYRSLPAEIALDALNESWKPVDGPQHIRPIQPNSRIANSVALRVQYALNYTPPNLIIKEGALAQTYSLEQLIEEEAALSQ